MSQSKQQSSSFQEAERFLHSYSSDDKFVKEYKKRCYGKVKSKEHYLLVLIKLENAVLSGNIDTFKRFVKVVDLISNIESRETLESFYSDTQNPIKNTNLVILACKHNRFEILKCILGNGKFLENLSVNVGKDAITPDDKDELCHDAFYYAVLSGNVELLDLLIKNWPYDYFSSRSEELDEILSKAYEELKLKNVSLSESMEIFVENQLINLRFFSNLSKKDQVSDKDQINSIMERVDLVLEKIDLLKSEYSNVEKFDEKFLFVARFIAQNIHVLKRQLKVTYDRLPWEEIEFCLISFISSHLKEQEINLFYCAILNKNKILRYLVNFAEKLEAEKCHFNLETVSKLAEFPKLKRDQVVEEIIQNQPEFKDLYDDYQRIRDVHSLQKMREYLNLALSIDPKKKQGQLIITRALQVIGEYLKNTLESPKLSAATSELLIMLLPKNTRKIIIDLRNSLSHSRSLSKRTEIEQNPDINFFIGIQNDTKKIYDVITDILSDKKIKMIRKLMHDIINSENPKEVKNIVKALKFVEMDKMSENSFQLMEFKNLEKLISEMIDAVVGKTPYEKLLLIQIVDIMNIAQNRSRNVIFDCAVKFIMLKGQLKFLQNDISDISDSQNFKNLKILLNSAVENIFSDEKSSHSFKEIVELTVRVSLSAMLRLQGEDLDKLFRSTFEICHFAESKMNVASDIKWIEKLRSKLYERGANTLVCKDQTCGSTKDKYDEQLTLKLSQLKTILKDDRVKAKGESNKEILYENNRKFQTAVETLVLDILSILGESDKHLEDNLLFLDSSTPLLLGKCLRDHLAHGNTILDVLLSDPSTAIVLNAEKLASENIVKCDKKIGKFVKDDPAKLKVKFDKALATVANQQKMFAALQAGNLEELQNCTAEGADIRAKSINSWSALHFASCGPNLEVVKFILAQHSDVNVKDLNNQTPLHVAATYGRKNIVEFFSTERNISINARDHNGNTPLHIAAFNGHKAIVEILLQNNADCNVIDKLGHAPVHFAALRNHVDIVQLLLEKSLNDDYEAVGGFTLLHLAAEYGRLEVVNFLLNRGANIGAKSDRGGTPLHSACLNGHFEVVEALILKGADVNDRVLDGTSPLLHAVESGNQKVVNILLKHGANVNIADKTRHYTPLQCAAKHGHKEIADTLLSYKADVDSSTVGGTTPLHFAAERGHLNVANVLLKYDVNIYARDRNFLTALHYALINGHTKVAELLIQNGAEINPRTYGYPAPLYVAALKGYQDIVALLVKNKARVDIRNKGGDTPLFAAAHNGHVGICELLLKNKFVINITNYYGMTPLYAAAMGGHVNVIDFLIKNGADMNKRDDYDYTPLHTAILHGHRNVVEFLIENNVDVNAKPQSFANSSFHQDTLVFSPLCLAVEAGFVEIVEILVANKADVNDRSKRKTPLISAIKREHKRIVEILIANGADVNETNGEPLFEAILKNSKDIMNILLQNKARIDFKGYNNVSLLHVAVEMGHKDIVNILIRKKIEVNALTIDHKTPLFIASREGHEEILEILIKNKADVNVSSSEGTPLHAAARCGHANIVKLLLQNGAKIIQCCNIRSPLELAIANGHLHVIKTLLQQEQADIETGDHADWTLLHIASQKDNLEIVKYLVNKGCNIHAKSSCGLKPIHIAASAGLKNIVKFFLSKGLKVNEGGKKNQTLLHYAIMLNELKMVKYLISKGAGINTKDDDGSTPLHSAAYLGFRDCIRVLLENGAVYNPLNNGGLRPLDMMNITRDGIDTTASNEIANLFVSTEKLFEEVKLKNSSSSVVENLIKSGAFVNAKNANTEVTPLHYAAQNGCRKVVDILLDNDADPNAVCSKRFTPLHYAAKFSNFECVKALLCHGAMYNPVSTNGKTPLSFASDKNITKILKLTDQYFKMVKSRNFLVPSMLMDIDNNDTLKAIMNACNQDKKTLIGAASQENLFFTDILLRVSDGDLSAQFDEAVTLLNKGFLQPALNIFNRLLNRRKQLLGPNNLATLNIMTLIARIWYAQGHYQTVVDTLEEIYHKQKEMLGFENRYTLETRSLIALVFHRQGKNEEAFKIFQQVYPKQKDILGHDHMETVNTHFHMALVLDSQGKYEEALRINKEVFEIRKKVLGINDVNTAMAQNNIAMVLSSMGKYDESLKMYKEVLEKKKFSLGINNVDTLKTLHNIAGVLFLQNKHSEALRTFQEVLSIQKTIVPLNHPEILKTQISLANVLLQQGKYISAFKIFMECYDHTKTVFGPEHRYFVDIEANLEVIKLRFKMEGLSESEIIQHLQTDIIDAVCKGDFPIVKLLLKGGVDVDESDIDGRTPLHYAVNNGHFDIVNILLDNGADITHATKKGNTPLHTATSKRNTRIVNLLLQRVSREKLNNFVNAITTSGGNTSVHVAAKNGRFDIVKSLLKHGAMYDVANNEGKTPIDLSTNQEITELLKVIDELFDGVKKGTIQTTNKLKSMMPDEFSAAMNARNTQGNKLLQVAFLNRQKSITDELLKMLNSWEDVWCLKEISNPCLASLHDMYRSLRNVPN